MLRLMPKGWYHTTITQVNILEKNQNRFLSICFTINTGEFAYRNVRREYPMNAFGYTQMETHFMEVGLFVYTGRKEELLTKQFVGKSQEVHIDREKKGDVIRNFILEMKTTTAKPEFDVTREKKEDYYYENNKGRKLCLTTNRETIKKKQFTM